MTEIGTWLMEFGDFLIWFGLAWLIVTVGIALLEALLIMWLRDRMPRELQAVDQALEQERLIALTVEVENDQYLCYNSITSDFVCQGRDLKEIRERFRARYPTKDAAIYDGDETAVATLKSQLKDLKEAKDKGLLS